LDRIIYFIDNKFNDLKLAQVHPRKTFTDDKFLARNKHHLEFWVTEFRPIQSDLSSRRKDSNC